MAEIATDERTIFTKLTLGFKVQKVGILTADDDLFTVFGLNSINLLYGRVTTVMDGGASTVALNEKASSIAIAKATTIDSDTVGQLYLVSGQSDAVLNGGLTPVLKVASMNADHETTVDDVAAHAPFILSGGTGGLVIESTETGNDATGEILWVLYYFPLEAGAIITAAA